VRPEDVVVDIWLSFLPAQHVKMFDEHPRALGAVLAERRVGGKITPASGPPHIRSRTAASSATRIGSSSGRVTIAVPRRIRVV
jgi:hypothetical protein